MPSTANTRLPLRPNHDRAAERTRVDQRLRPPAAVRRSVPGTGRRRARGADRPGTVRGNRPFSSCWQAATSRTPARGSLHGGSVRLNYLPQEEVFSPGQTVREVLLAALAGEHIEDHERETRAAITLTQVGFTDEDQPRRQTLRRLGANGWPWPASWFANRTFCCLTSRPTISTGRASPGWDG